MPDQYDTSTLLSVVNQLQPFEPFLLTMFFPEVVNFETSTIDFDVVSDNMELAPFVSPLVAGKADKANGGTLLKFKPAYIKPKEVVDPERVIKRRAGEPLGGGGLMSPDAKRNAIIADILENQRKRIMMTKEWMAAQALLTGKVIVAGEDYPEVEVDFQRAAANTVTLAGILTWDAANLATADPLGDIEDWGAVAEAPITKLVFDKLAWKDFIRFQAVKDLLDTRRGSQSQLELGPDNGRNFSYKGMLGADIECWVYSGYYKDAAGVKQNYMLDNTVIAGSGAVEGVRAHGAILDSAAGYRAMEFFPKNWMQDDPAAEYVMSQSAPLMIPKRPDAIVTATVK